jgi:dTMP kinase
MTRGGDTRHATRTKVFDPTTLQPTLKARMFGSPAFMRLWFAGLGSSFGDWMGFLALAALASDLGGADRGAGIGIVMVTRMVPGLFLSQVGGILADRFDRKMLMVSCDLGRFAILCTLPFFGNSLWQIALFSLALEMGQLLWAPAKEASVPNLVPSEKLAQANSLSVLASYATFPLAAGAFSAMLKLVEWLGTFDALSSVTLNRVSVALFVDALSFLMSGLIIATLPLPQPARTASERHRINVSMIFEELREGWKFAFVNPTVRAVMAGLSTGLLGGGMLVPLGPVFVKDVLRAGAAGFGSVLLALGLGVAAGVGLVTVIQGRLSKEKAFTTAVLVAGVCLITAASMSSFRAALTFVFAIGAAAGFVYVLGFTLLHQSVEDELRGRVFSTLNTLVRLVVVVSSIAGPFLSSVLDGLSRRLLGDRRLSLGIEIFVPGVRLTLWLAGVIIVAAGLLAFTSLKAGTDSGRFRDVGRVPV